MPGCCTVWLAPVSRSSGGRSALSSSSGTWSAAASTTAGSRLATAVPEETTTAQQRPVARARPRPRKAAPRSSVASECGSPLRATATVSGAQREPGQSTTCARPPRRSSSTSTAAQSKLRFSAARACASKLGCSTSLLAEGGGRAGSLERGAGCGAGGKSAVKSFILACVSSSSWRATEPATSPAPA